MGKECCNLVELGLLTLGSHDLGMVVRCWGMEGLRGLPGGTRKAMGKV